MKKLLYFFNECTKHAEQVWKFAICQSVSITLALIAVADVSISDIMML